MNSSQWSKPDSEEASRPSTIYTHIHMVKQILEKYNESNKRVNIAFVDYTKASASLNHKYIWDTLEK